MAAPEKRYRQGDGEDWSVFGVFQVAGSQSVISNLIESSLPYGVGEVVASTV